MGFTLEIFAKDLKIEKRYKGDFSKSCRYTSPWLPEVRAALQTSVQPRRDPCSLGEVHVASQRSVQPRRLSYTLTEVLAASQTSVQTRRGPGSLAEVRAASQRSVQRSVQPCRRPCRPEGNSGVFLV